MNNRQQTMKNWTIINKRRKIEQSSTNDEKLNNHQQTSKNWTIVNKRWKIEQSSKNVEKLNNRQQTLKNWTIINKRWKIDHIRKLKKFLSNEQFNPANYPLMHSVLQDVKLAKTLFAAFLVFLICWWEFTQGLVQESVGMKFEEKKAHPQWPLNLSIRFDADLEHWLSHKNIVWCSALKIPLKIELQLFSWLSSGHGVKTSHQTQLIYITMAHVNEWYVELLSFERIYFSLDHPGCPSRFSWPRTTRMKSHLGCTWLQS